MGKLILNQDLSLLDFYKFVVLLKNNENEYARKHF